MKKTTREHRNTAENPRTPETSMRLLNSSRFTRAAIAGLAVLIAFAMAGCVSTADEKGATANAGSGGGDCKGGEVMIGSTMSATGFMSVVDAPALGMAKIAIERVNADGGVLGCKLKLVEVDGESNPDKEAQIATDLVAKGAKLLLVTCDYDITAKASQVAQAAGVLVISPCLGDTIMGPKSGLTLGFSMGSAVPGEAAIMAEYAFKTFGPKAALFRDMSLKYTQNQCKDFQTRWKQLGGTIVADPQFNQTPQAALAAPVSAQVNEIKGAHPDVIALCSYPGGGAEALATLRKSGDNTPVISGFAMDGAYWLGAVPNLSNFYDVTYASVFGDDPNEKIQKLLQEYKEKTGQDAVTSSPLTGASSIEAFAKAAEDAKSFDGAALAKALESFKDVELTVGSTSFSPQLHINVTRPMAVIEVQNGKHKFVTYQAAEKPVAE
jgi:branched-chain amino acid transport system substrate-binding protein